MRRSALIGREAELEELSRAVAKNRIVTMTGAPGVGKTALATAFAESRPSVLCALFGVTGADATCREIARALGLSSSATGIGGGHRRAHRTRPRESREDSRGARRRRPRVRRADQAPSDLAARCSRGPVPGRRANEGGAPRGATRRAGSARGPTGPRPDLGSHRARRRGPPLRALRSRGSTGLPSHGDHGSTRRGDRTRARGLAARDRAVCVARRSPRRARIAQMLAERLDALDTSSTATGGRTLRGAFALSWDRARRGRRARARGVRRLPSQLRPRCGDGRHGTATSRDGRGARAPRVLPRTRVRATGAPWRSSVRAPGQRSRLRG